MRGRGFAAVSLASLVAIVLLDALIVDVREPKGDDLVYERMAQDPGGTHTFPFAFRVAVPWLVHVLPGSATFGFSLVAWVCTALAGGVAYLLLRHFEVPPWAAAALAIAFAISPPLLVVSLRQGRNVDPASILVMLLGALFVAQRRPWALGATLLAGAFVRESSLFLIPFAYAYWAARPIDAACLRRVAVLAAPAVVAFAALRLAIPTVGREQVPGYDRPFLDARVDVARYGLDNIRLEARRMASTFGPLWLGLPFAVRELRFARAGLVLVGLCVVALTFAVDWGRMVFLAAPVVLVAAGWAVRRDRRLATAMVAALLLLNGVYAVHMQRSGVRVGIEGAHGPTYPIQ